MNVLLIQRGYLLAIVKNEKRYVYISALETVRQTGSFLDFYLIIVQAVEESFDAYLEAVDQSA